MYAKGSQKRLGTAVALCLILMFVISGPVMAVDQASGSILSVEGINPSPRLTYINQIVTAMNTSAAGITASGSIIAYPGMVDEVWIFLYLERYENGRWVTVGS